MPVQVTWIWLGAMGDALPMVGALAGREVQVVGWHWFVEKLVEAIRVFQSKLLLAPCPWR